MKLNQDGVCGRCRQRDKNMDGSPYLMSDDNHIDPGSVPSFLSSLTQIKEMLIAHAHVHIEVKRVRSLLAIWYASCKMSLKLSTPYHSYQRTWGLLCYILLMLMQNLNFISSSLETSKSSKAIFGNSYNI